MTLEQAIAVALEHHPSLRSAVAEEEQSAGKVELARSSELPQLNASAELLRGTGNVLRGPLYPAPGIPAVSGPPQPSSFDSGAFGSLVGLGASWDLLQLRQRMAEVDAALADHRYAQAATRAQRVLVAFNAADAFIAFESAAENTRVAQAGVDRAGVFAKAVKTLADSELRPQADAARSQAELALATTQLARAQQAEATAQVRLAEAMGMAGQQVQPIAGPLLEVPAERVSSSTPTPQPEVEAAAAAVGAAEEQSKAVGLQYLPRLELAASLWLRGSGLAAGTVAPSPGDGLVPNTPNWSAGVVLTVPILDVYAIRAREHVAASRVQAARAREDSVSQAVQSQLDMARAELQSAAVTARNAVTALEAARLAERQATARFNAGLGSVVEVADAQRLLIQAEAEESGARLSVWRARLYLARALGDLDPFLEDLRRQKGR